MGLWCALYFAVFIPYIKPKKTSEWRSFLVKSEGCDGLFASHTSQNIDPCYRLPLFGLPATVPILRGLSHGYGTH